MLFQRGSFEEVAERALEQGKLLVAYFTASWCEPCRAMERTTWRDARVAAYFQAHVLAVKVDVELSAALTRAHDVQSMPTLVVFQGGEERDRHRGMIHADGLLSWLEAVRVGKTRPRVQEGANDVRERHALGRTCMQRGDLGGASEHLLWVWNNALQFMRAYVGVRHSYLVRELRELARLHAPTRAALQQLASNAHQVVLERGPSREALMEWSSLCVASGDASACLAWLEALRALPEGLDASSLELVFGTLAREHGKLEALGRLYPAPEQVIEQLRKMRELVLSADVPGFAKDELVNTTFREHATRAHGAYVAANRASDARAFARGVRAIDPRALMKRPKPTDREPMAE